MHFKLVLNGKIFEIQITDCKETRSIWCVVVMDLTRFLYSESEGSTIDDGVRVGVLLNGWCTETHSEID